MASRKIISFVLVGFLFIGCNTTNKYSVSAFITQLYFAEKEVESDSIKSLYQCHTKINSQELGLYLGLNFKIAFDIFRENRTNLLVPEPGIEGIHIPVKSIVVKAYFQNHDSISLSNIKLEDDFQYYKILDCSESMISRSVSQNKLRSLDENVYVLSNSHRNLTFGRLVTQLNSSPLEAEEEYFLLLDTPVLIQNLDKLSSITIMLQFLDGSTLISTCNLIDDH